MNSASAKMLVSVGQKCACVKISGRANFTSSVDFKTLLSELIQKGYTRFVLDLSECTLMDSTFLGVLAGFGLKMNGPKIDDSRPTLELYNASPRIVDLLENLGVLQLFKVVQGDPNLPENSEQHDMTPANPSREEVKLTCLEAHQALIEAHPDNSSRFKDVAQFLTEDLKKIKSRS